MNLNDLFSDIEKIKHQLWNMEHIFQNIGNFPWHQQKNTTDNIIDPNIFYFTIQDWNLHYTIKVIENKDFIWFEYNWVLLNIFSEWFHVPLSNRKYITKRHFIYFLEMLPCKNYKIDVWIPHHYTDKYRYSKYMNKYNISINIKENHLMGGWFSSYESENNYIDIDLYNYKISTRYVKYRDTSA